MKNISSYDGFLNEGTIDSFIKAQPDMERVLRHDPKVLTYLKEIERLKSPTINGKNNSTTLSDTPMEEILDIFRKASETLVPEQLATLFFGARHIFPLLAVGSNEQDKIEAAREIFDLLMGTLK